MYARKDIRTVLPDAVLRCRKLQAASNIALDEMEKTKYRRINSLDWQQQTFQRVINERHKRWRMYDRAFRLKMKRELGPDLAAALRLRTMHEEEQKFLLEQQLIEHSFNQERKEPSKQRDDASETHAETVIDKVTKANSAHPKSQKEKITVQKPPQSAVESRRIAPSSAKMNQTMVAASAAAKLAPRRAKTSEGPKQTARETDPEAALTNNFGSVLCRILSNIAATPDLDDDSTIRRRAAEARERRLIRARDDRYFKLVQHLSSSQETGKDLDQLF